MNSRDALQFYIHFTVLAPVRANRGQMDSQVAIEEWNSVEHVIETNRPILVTPGASLRHTPSVPSLFTFTSWLSIAQHTNTRRRATKQTRQLKTTADKKGAPRKQRLHAHAIKLRFTVAARGAPRHDQRRVVWCVYDETTRRGVNTYPACIQWVVPVVEHLHFL